MNRIALFTRAASAAALMALSAVPAHASDDDRARAAIAEARGKIEAGDKIGTSGEAPGIQARARAALRDAEDLLAHGKEKRAIIAAHSASELADSAIMAADQRRGDAQNAARVDAVNSAAMAQQSAADANARAADAQNRAYAAEQQAAATAAQAAAQAEAMRAAAPTTTIVTTTEQSHVVRTPAKRTVKRVVVHRPARATVVKKTTTTVTTGQ